MISKKSSNGEGLYFCAESSAVSPGCIIFNGHHGTCSLLLFHFLSHSYSLFDDALFWQTWTSAEFLFRSTYLHRFICQQYGNFNLVIHSNSGVYK